MKLPCMILNESIMIMWLWKWVLVLQARLVWFPRLSLYMLHQCRLYCYIKTQQCLVPRLSSPLGSARHRNWEFGTAPRTASSVAHTHKSDRLNRAVATEENDELVQISWLCWRLGCRDSWRYFKPCSLSHVWLNATFPWLSRRVCWYGCCPTLWHCEGKLLVMTQLRLYTFYVSFINCWHLVLYEGQLHRG